MDEPELLLRWRQGDRQAGNTLIRRHYARVFEFVYRKVGGDEALSDDITQQVFAVLMSKDEPIQKVSAYLRRVAYLMVLDHHRRSKRYTITTTSALLSDDRSNSSLLSGGQQQAIMIRALRRLSVEDQLLIAYVYGDGKQQREIAEQLGMRVSQINGKVARARARLRRMVEAYEPSPEGPPSGASADFDVWLDSIHGRVEP